MLKQQVAISRCLLKMLSSSQYIRLVYCGGECGLIMGLFVTDKVTPAVINLVIFGVAYRAFDSCLAIAFF